MEKSDLESLGITGEQAERVLELYSSGLERETEALRYEQAVSRCISRKNIKFSSKAAERAYISELKEKKLPLRDGELEGFEQWHQDYVKNDPGAVALRDLVKPVGLGGAPERTVSRAAELSRQYHQNLYGMKGD